MRKKKLLSICLSVTLVFTVLGAVSPALAADAGKSVMTDFSGPVDPADWRTGSKPDGAVKVDGGVLKFDGAQDGSLIGPQASYGDFALAFDIAGFEGNSSWLGLSFGLPKPDSFFAAPEPYLLLLTNDSVILLRNKVADTVPWDDPAQRWIPADHALATNEEPLNVKVVLKEGTLKVFFKLKSEAASVLDTPRAVFSNLPNISGYINLTTSGNDTVQGYFSLDNLKVFDNPDADTSVAIPGAAEPEPSTDPSTEPTSDEPSNPVKVSDPFITVGKTGYRVDPATGNIWKGKTYIAANKKNLPKIPKAVLKAARAAKAAKKKK